MDLGSVLRLKRKEKKMTLKAVAEKAGISEGFLSQIENNVNSPSVDTLMNICSAIGCNAAEVIEKAQNQERIAVIRKNDLSDVDIPHVGFATRRFFPPESRRTIDSAILIIEPGKSIPARKGVRNSQEVLCVIKGSLELTYNRDVLTLNQGDTAHFWTLPDNQVVTNKSHYITIALWIGTM
ncbi:MAG: helix-turn-helix domain-containing protein [Spirochaetes bacterium]|nr:helix-turn-helix domain-containing protein [Spirochaetota bacterium]NMB65103.1 helix-turn-helix domain-containing protein [Spirochaetota bacterium]HOJ29652.1 helix-turn-helix domain-containing protein [Spirochaetota bacterium]HOM10815.1 helix-turn-helix domain-containing protein [Spirochaetota bacterium]HPP50662.1 helix-turn-helix domain-containing protein [Spirochaetota bacterium]